MKVVKSPFDKREELISAMRKERAIIEKLLNAIQESGINLEEEMELLRHELEIIFCDEEMVLIAENHSILRQEQEEMSLLAHYDNLATQVKAGNLTRSGFVHATVALLEKHFAAIDDEVY